jgi:hypothetical protein
VNLVMNLSVRYNARKLPSGCRTGGLASSAQFHRVGRSVGQSQTLMFHLLLELVQP